MVGIYILIAVIGILAVVEIILNFAEITAFFGLSFELFSEGHYVEGVFGVIIATAMIIALLTPAVKEMKKEKSKKK